MMFRRPLLILVELGVVCIALIAMGLFWVSWYIDTDEFRETFLSLLQDATGRNVELEGEIDIALWPGLVLDVENLSIGESAGFGGGGQFAHFDRIRISVRLIPLLSEHLDIRTIIVEGMELSIVQDSDGKFNWQSILDRHGVKSLPDSSPAISIGEVSLSGLEVINASVTYKDGPEDNGYALSGINLRTGAIESGENVPFTVSSTFSWIDGGVESDLTLKGMFETGGDGSGIALKDATLYASVGGVFLPDGANPGELTARVVMDWNNRSVALNGLRVRFLGLRAEGNLESGDLRKDLSAKGHVTVHPFKPAKIITRYFPNAPVKSVDGLESSAFTSFFHVDETGVSFRDVALTLDDMTVRGQLAFKGYSRPIFSFGLRGNTIDLDRYIPLFRTDTPFIWDDFNLKLFKKFRGQGAIRADGFKVLDTLVSDIRLSVKADKDGILLDAGAIKKGQASLGGKTKIVIGENGEGIPVLTISAQLIAESQKDGFAFLKAMPLSLGGAGVLNVKAKATRMVCPPDGRSINLLQHLEGSASLSLGAGTVRYRSKSEKPLLLDYSKADILLSATPMKGVAKGYYGYTTTADVKTHGGTDVEVLSFTVQGPLITAIDTVHVKSPGMDVKGHLTSVRLPRKARRVSASGKIAFDSNGANFSITDGFVRLLETSIRGSASVTGLDKNIEASGKLTVSEVNPKRIIYLLSDVVVLTKNAEALKKVEVAARFKADQNGFTLSELEGSLDGMSFNGHVVGQGFKNPMLAFSFAAGSFDLDQYLPPSPIMSLEERRAGKVKKAPPVDLPLGFLKALRLNGKGFFEDFKLADIRSRAITANVKADEGKIHIFDVKGKIHDGQLTADWKGEVGETELTTHLKLHVEDMQVGPLLKDMAKRDYVRGETDVDIDLKSRGATDDDILKNLNGKTWMRIRNGSFKFTGYDSKPVETTSNVDTLNRNSQTRPRPRTVFQKAMAYFTVNNGVFTVDKYRVEAPPLLQSYGKGSFSLADNTVDVAIRNDFVAVPSVTVQITGRLTDPEINIPTGKIVNDTVRNILSLPEKSFEFLRDLFH